MENSNLILDQVASNFTNLGKEEGNYGFIPGEFTGVSTIEVKSVSKAFTSWMAIYLGTGLKPIRNFNNTFQNNDRQMTDKVRTLFKHKDFWIVSRPIEVELVVISIAELGFEYEAKYSEICDRARKLGFGLCPPEVGLQICLQCKNLNEADHSFIAMKPIEIGRRSIYGYSTSYYLFYVMQSGSNILLNTYDVNPNFYHPWSKLIFLRSKEFTLSF